VWRRNSLSVARCDRRCWRCCWPAKALLSAAPTAQHCVAADHAAQLASFFAADSAATRAAVECGRHDGAALARQ